MPAVLLAAAGYFPAFNPPGVLLAVPVLAAGLVIALVAVAFFVCAFGTEAGAFTGANEDREGFFQAAGEHAHGLARVELQPQQPRVGEHDHQRIALAGAMKFVDRLDGKKCARTADRA